MHEQSSEYYLSLTQMLEYNAKRFANDVALRQKKLGIWQEKTWQDYFSVTQHIAAGLLSLEAGMGSHIGIIAENCEEWILCQLGINFLGGVACGVYPSSPPNEVLHLLSSADCSLVFCEDQEQVDKVLDIESQLPLLRHIIVFNSKGLKNYQHPKLVKLDKLIEIGAKKLQTDPEIVASLHKQQHPSDSALIVFTSGSTGLPKAAMISYENIWHEMHVLSNTVPTKPGQNILSYLPLCHIAEQAVSNFNSIRNRIVINFGESLRTIRSDLQEISPDLFFGVPRIWEKMQSEITVLSSRCGPIRRWLIHRAMSNAEKFGETLSINRTSSQKLSYFFWYWLIYKHLLNYLGLGRCQFAMTAAAPISPHLLAVLRGMGIRLIEIFGMTETTGAATIQSITMDSQGRIGAPVQGVQCKLAEDGELLVKGGIVFKGYYKNELATNSTIVDGWLHTGDIATVFGDGSYSIVDRKKDIMINAAGKNLSPSLIENTIKSSPYIKECICIAESRPYVVALIQIDTEAVSTWAENNNISYTTFRSLSLNDQVLQHISNEVSLANTKLARVEQIKRFYLLPKELDHDDGEVTATMKVKRSKIATQYAEHINELYSEKASA